MTNLLVAYGHGDSIFYGAGDNQSNQYAFGIFGRALLGNGTPTQFRAGFNACVSGTSQSNYNSNSKIRYWEFCADIVVDNEATNDFASTGTLITAAACITLKHTGWTNSKTVNSSVKLITCMCACRTTGPWTTEAGQVVTGVGWGVSGNVQTYNTSLLAEVGVNVDAIIRRDTERGILGDPTLWRAPPTITTDGLHPNSTATISSASDLANAFTSFDSPVAINTIDTNISHGQTGSITTTGLGNLTVMTIGAVAVASLNSPLGDGSYTMPARANGVTVAGYGSGVAVSVGDGASTATGTINMVVPTGEAYVTVASPVSTDNTYLHYYITLANGDQVGFNTNTTQGVTNNQINANSQIVTDYVGSQTIWIWRSATKTMIQATLKKTAGGIISVILGGAGSVASSSFTRRNLTA